MLLTITTPGVRDHHSDREVSTALFLPANIGSMAGELPRTLQYLRAVNNPTIQENMGSSPNINFRAAVQFMQLSRKLIGKFGPSRYPDQNQYNVSLS
jgi:hypothetical protein